jgi:hypothetical protein
VFDQYGIMSHQIIQVKLHSTWMSMGQITKLIFIQWVPEVILNPPNFRTAKKFSTLIVRIGKKGYGQSFDDAGIPEYSFDHWMFFLKSIFEKFK